MKAFSRLLILIFLISFGFAQAQKGKIAGKVIDKNTGEEIIGATVAIEGQTIGSSTDIEGRFSIS
ncbi:MAG: carboxypeptidase-like regulatory domain-containing protein, partial [Bacteroidota bacterium]|nr:carboxypeptidase-like regulatory domain-containing protein [Bacteroidota bacterium]